MTLIAKGTWTIFAGSSRNRARLRFAEGYLEYLCGHLEKQSLVPNGFDRDADPRDLMAAFPFTPCQAHQKVPAVRTSKPETCWVPTKGTASSRPPLKAASEQRRRPKSKQRNGPWNNTCAAAGAT